MSKLFFFEFPLSTISYPPRLNGIEVGDIAGVLPAGRGPGEGAPRYPPGSAGLGADHHQALKLAEFCIFLLKIFLWGGRGRSGRRARASPAPYLPIPHPPLSWDCGRCTQEGAAGRGGRRCRRRQFNNISMLKSYFQKYFTLTILYVCVFLLK